MTRLIVILLVLSCAPIARADAVGALDPLAADVCGGSAHDPRCPPELFGGACCAVFALGLAMVGLRGVMRGKDEGPREGPGER